MLIYIRMTAAATSPSIFTYSGQPFSGHASVQATMRAQ
jgi:hypothetical protein